MDFHEMDQAQLLESVKTDPSRGLSAEEARQRQEMHGFNVLAEVKKQSVILSFFSQFKDLMIGLAALPTFLLAGTFFFKPKAAKIEKS